MLGITERTIVGLGVAKEVAIEIEHTLNPTLAITETKESNTEKTSCLVCSQTYVAYGDDEVMGNDATVFIGGSKTASMVAVIWATSISSAKMEMVTKKWC